jgi:integrase
LRERLANSDHVIIFLKSYSTRVLDRRKRKNMRRSMKSHSEPVPVDAHERTRDYVTEEEFLGLVEATHQSRHHWRDAAMLMLTFYHGLREGVTLLPPQEV